MEQKPNKKEELMLANNVLKLAADLLKVKTFQFIITLYNMNIKSIFEKKESN